jgi:hypothetical protein
VIIFASFLAGILFGAGPVHTVLTVRGKAVLGGSQNRQLPEELIEVNPERKITIARLLERRQLPPLPDSRAPWSSQWSNNMAICATMRDENITDVQEWIEYYKYDLSV